MKKYKVLLIDDEPIIIEGLKIIIPWDNYNCQIIGTISKSLEALKLIETYKPDIVIADINMPNLSGIEMIRQSLNIHPCKFIVLSGYSDFSYAKQCISLGVQEYLLKPLDKDLLIKSLQKVQKQIDEEKSIKKTAVFLEEANKKLFYLSQDETLRDIMNSLYDSNTDFLNVLGDFSINLKSSLYYTVATVQFPTDFKNLDPRQALDEEISKQFKNYLLFYTGNNIYACLLSLETEKYFNEISQLHRNLRERLNSDICIGVGKDYNEIQKVTLSYKQANFSLSYKNIRGFHSINYFNNDLKQAHYILTIPNDLLNNFYASLKQDNFQVISSSIEKIYYYMKKICNMPILGIQINSLNLIMNSFQQYANEDNLLNIPSYENADYIQEISTINQVNELEKYVINKIYLLINSQSHINIGKSTNVIHQIEKYINTNYSEDLSLATVSKKFYISPIYLSQSFKKQTGQLYLNYVTQVKINAAKKMLESTDMMIYEIAEKLNYKDSKYFSRLFEKKTGKKPSDYRKDFQ